MDISTSRWLFEGKNCLSSVKARLISGYVIKWMAFRVTALMLVLRFDCIYCSHDLHLESLLMPRVKRWVVGGAQLTQPCRRRSRRNTTAGGHAERAPCSIQLRSLPLPILYCCLRASLSLNGSSSVMFGHYRFNFPAIELLSNHHAFLRVLEQSCPRK